MSGESPGLSARLVLMVLTHPSPACGRDPITVIGECIEAGATAIQIRDKEATARELAALTREALRLARPAGALLIVNDRVDVALATGADGAHLGPHDLPVHAARRVVPPDFILGYSTDEPEEGRRAAAAGADYLGVGAVYGTRSKACLEEEAIGPERVREVREASGLPCLGIGGITPENAAEVYATGAGVAVLAAVMNASDPGAVVRRLLEARSGS